MDKKIKSILLLIVVSLIVAGVLNNILGAFLEPGSNKPDTQANSSSVQGTIFASQASHSIVQETAPVSSEQSDKALPSTPTLSPTPALSETPEKELTSTSGAATTEDFQDDQWIANVQKHSALLSNDIEEVGNATSGSSPDALAIYGQYLVDDTQTAIEENNQYMVSPKYQDAQKECELALRDYSSAGELLTQTSSEAKNKNTDDDEIKQALSLIDSGSGHFRKVHEIFDNAA